jgi:hypothetical protein
VSGLEDAALGRAMREMAEAAQLPKAGGWVFTITTHGGFWHLTARVGDYPRPGEEDRPDPTFLYGEGATLTEAVHAARQKMLTREEPTK